MKGNNYFIDSHNIPRIMEASSENVLLFVSEMHNFRSLCSAHPSSLSLMMLSIINIGLDWAFYSNKSCQYFSFFFLYKLIHSVLTLVLLKILRSQAHF